MAARERLKHKLQILAGTAPGGPSDSELNLIIQDIVQIRKQRTPTDADWITATLKHVHTAGKYCYAGEDMSDLNALLVQILNMPTPGTGTVNKGS